MPPPPPVPEESVEEATPALLEEILEQIFLRLPPDDPACLVRASLASKHWLALLTGPRFRGRYREHHRAPPMLGFLKTVFNGAQGRRSDAPPFVSTTGFPARLPDDGWGLSRDYTPVDCRHGLLLLTENIKFPEDDRRKLAVWDPMTGRRRELQEPQLAYRHGFYAAAVLCAMSGCDHLACREGTFRFRVAFLSLRHDGAHLDFVAQVRVSSLEPCDCSKPCSDFHHTKWSHPCPGVSVGGDGGYIEPRPPVLVNGALHFMLTKYDRDAVPFAQVLKYDLSSNCLSLIDAPKAGANMVLMAMEDGCLGFAHINKLTLFIWSRQMGSDGVTTWTRRRVIGLENLLPIQSPREYIRLLGSVEGSDIIFVTMKLGIYKIDLKSLQQKKISNGEDMDSLMPYMSFYNPREKGETL